ncbi:glycine--tRNA ligase subunit beta [Coxiella burnetii]|nr:glycyl-tRNA synthetase beta chain [Coxiella burnetii CbuG_Q212]ATN65962.1 glycine--tRNA ligase subunit beta [Coxiella burnetii]OYK87066.1 glycine--tRNA ligase subunit beta [Coxiella burnetii]
MLKMTTQDFLLEIGCEELPPRRLNQLSQALSQTIKSELEKADLSFENIHRYATPRRLAVLVNNLALQQPQRKIERQGPSVKAAFDKDQTPTLACFGFAQSCGVSTAQLKVKKTKKGEFIYCEIEQPGQNTLDLLPNIIQSALKQLPTPKAMRWGDHKEFFVRPVHWIILMLGKDLVPATLLGKMASCETRGHRFHHPKNILVTKPDDYQKLLLTHGMVIADFEKRREKIRDLIQKAASEKGEAIIDEGLLEEVTGMVEWPVILVGNFKAEFLELPPEVLITTMKVHQRTFPIKNKNGDLLPYFIIVSNIESKNPKRVIVGNERVINARLADASFFYDNDLRTSLENRLPKLGDVIFQRQLGTLADKARRIEKLAAFIAKQTNIDEQLAARAGLLSKCDLVSEMVYEFPTLQGIMGYYCAFHDKEPPLVAEAIKEHYLPRFSGDQLPRNLLSACVAVADRIDTIIGIIGINKSPTGDKDPFALRRAALGILRILIEKELSLDLFALLNEAKNNYAVELPNVNVVNQSFDFIIERLRAWYLEKEVPASVFMAVLASHPADPLDFDRRIKAVQHFQTLPEADALAAANKRVSNILKKQAAELKSKTIDHSLFDSDAEHLLADQLKERAELVNNLYKKADYTKALSELASLKEPIDIFFDKVMVMVDDKEKRENRLALLSSLQQLFSQIADISLLS